MNISDISVNEQSSIQMITPAKLYFDPFNLQIEPHDADMIFITHEHFDHYSPKDIEKAANEKTLFVIPQSMKEALIKQGIPSERITTLLPGQAETIAGVQVQAVAAYNLSKPFHLKSNGWLGYVITVDDSKIYICGDTDDTPEARQVSCDMICVPVGGTYTMDAKQAAALVNEIKPSVAIPIHYGTVVGQQADADVFGQNVDKDIKVCRKLFV